MEHQELVGRLAEDIETFLHTFKLVRFRGHKQISRLFKSFFKKCENLSKYCEKVRKKCASCSEIYHVEIMNIFNAFNNFKEMTNNYDNLATMSLIGIDLQLKLLERVLNASDFYVSYKFIKNEYRDVDEKEKAELKEYIEKGRILKDSTLTLKLKDELSNLKFIDSLPSYYSALVGPSYMGKTQTAFTLSHLVDLFYVNFAGMYDNPDKVDPEAGPLEQKIYRAMKPLSWLFFEAVWHDINSCKINQGHRGKNIKQGSKFFIHHKRRAKFETLGLIYTLLKWKNCHDDLYNDPEQWFLSFFSIKQIVIQSLTQNEFKQKMQESGLSLDNVVLFSDELPYKDENCKTAVRFLRNLCRIIHLPCMLSGTNSRVTNLIGKRDSKDSGPSTDEGLRPWVKVVTKTPHDQNSLLKCLGCTIDVKIDDDNTVKLNHYIENDKLNFDALLSDLISIDNDYDYGKLYVKSILEFLFEQLNTSLPGLMTECIKITLNQLSLYKKENFDLTTLWSIIVNETTKVLVDRKKKVLSSTGIMSTVHILTFPSEWKTANEEAKECAKNVNEHFFFYGPKSKAIFDVYLSNSSPPKLVEVDDQKYQDRVYFSEPEQDFLLSIVCLNTLFQKLDNNRKTLGTLGYYHRHQLKKRAAFKLNSQSTVQNAFALELLANWSICSASHLSPIGYARSMEVIERFLWNIQVVSPQDEDTAIMFQSISIPDSLKTFLNAFYIPYLFPDAVATREIVQKVSFFMKLGYSELTETGTGHDVFFQAGKYGQVEMLKCFIECKLYSSNVGLPEIYKYYNKACVDNYPISIIIANSFIELFDDPDAFSKLKIASDNRKAAKKLAEIIVKEVEAAKTTENTKKVKKFATKKSQECINGKSIVNDEKANVTANEEPKQKRVKTDYFELFAKLWESESNKINIYMIKFDAGQLSFNYSALLEFDNPVGVFLIAESNFDPPILSKND